MHKSHAALLSIILSASCFGQVPSTGSSTPPSQASPDHTVPANTSTVPGRDGGPVPSSVLQPSLDGLQKAVGALQFEKWKKGSVRDEAGTNVSSIQKDLQSTLPPLLKQADSAPQAVSKSLPVLRNIDALYDVLLRVVDGARIAAPNDQFTQLQSVMADLDKSRHTLSDQMQDRAAAQEKQIGDLQVALKTQPVPVCPVVAPPPAPAPAKKPAAKKRKPAAPKPATPPAGTAAPVPSKPSNP